MADSNTSSLLFEIIDSSFSELMVVVGHSQEEINAALPAFRQQFLTTFFFAMSTFLPKEDVEVYLARLKKPDLTALQEINERVSKEEWMASLMYAFEEVYGQYAKAVGPALTEEQKQQIQANFEKTFPTGAK